MMHFKFFLALVLSQSTWALSLTQTFSSRLVTSIECLTHKASTSAKTPIPTSTTTKTLLPDITVVIEASTPVRTITGAALTITSNVVTEATVTQTGAAVTDTSSSTSTETAVATSTLALTSISTVTQTTSTSTTSTSVIPAPSGFKPIWDTTGEQSLQGSSEKPKRQIADGVAHGGALLERHSKRSVDPFGGKYPASVLCVAQIQPRWVEKIIIVSGKTSTSTLIPPATTTTATSIVTSTSTVIPRASTTITSTVTTTSTSTATTISSGTTTSTTTIVSTSSTSAYAACATTNILGPQIARNSLYVDLDATLIAGGYGYGYVYNQDSAYNCCVDCLNDRWGNGCQYTIFQPNAEDPRYSVCQTIGQWPAHGDPALCDKPGLGFVSVKYTDAPSVFSQLVFSNGACGSVGSR